MPRVIQLLFVCLAFATGTVPATAQTNLVYEPLDYVIERFDSWNGSSGFTADFVQFTLGVNQLSGGESVTVTIKLPQALGIDLANSDCFSTTLSFFKSNVSATPIFSTAASVAYFDSSGAMLAPFSAAHNVSGRFGTIFGTTEIATGDVGGDDCAPFTAAHGVISQVQYSVSVPTYYSVTTGLTTTASLRAFRPRTSGTEVVPPLLVKGTDGISIQVAVSDAIAALTASGVSFDHASNVGVQLQFAMEATAGGDNRTAATAVRSVFDALDALVESGEVLPKVVRELRPNILKAIAGIRRSH
jgi:hypothetical protein